MARWCTARMTSSGHRVPSGRLCAVGQVDGAPCSCADITIPRGPDVELGWRGGHVLPADFSDPQSGRDKAWSSSRPFYMPGGEARPEGAEKMLWGFRGLRDRVQMQVPLRPCARCWTPEKQAPRWQDDSWSGAACILRWNQAGVTEMKSLLGRKAGRWAGVVVARLEG